jgi:hypothetical protein
MWFGYYLNLGIIVFAALAGFGVVHLEMNVGHGILLTAIAKIDLDWAEWAFKKAGQTKEEDHVTTRSGLPSDSHI